MHPFGVEEEEVEDMGVNTPQQPDAVMTNTAVSHQQLQDLARAFQPFLQSQAPAAQTVEGNQAAGIFRNGPANISDAKDISAQTIDLVRNSQANLQRAGVNVATGFTGYDLKTPAATLVPFLTPMLNLTPRIGGVGVPVHNWKAIVDFFGGNGPQSVIGAVQDGGTAQALSRTVIPMANTFQTIGLQDSLTFQAQWRGRQLEGDLRAMLTAQLLYALKLVEENWLINMSDQLWAPPAPMATASATGGTLAAGSYYMAVTAVNANGESLSTQVIGPIVTTGSTSSIATTIFTVPFAASYNVYAGTSASAAALFKQSAATNFGSASALNAPSNPLTGSFTATLASLATTGTTLPTVIANAPYVQKDTNTGLPVTWQGTQALLYANAGVNTGNATGGLKSQIIRPAATTGYLDLSDIQRLFLVMYLNARANPEYLFVSPQDGITIDNLVTAAGNTRVVVDATNAAQSGNLIGGFHAGRILNQATQRLVTIMALPFLPQGTIIAGSYSFPYPVSGFSTTPFHILTNQEYYGVDYPPTPATPTQWGMGDFVDETLVNEFLGGWGIINGIVYH